MNTTVLFFGELENIVGVKKIIFSDIENSALLIEKIAETYPQLKNKSYLIAVNHKVVNGTQEFNEGDEIALLPPFSGG